MSDANEFIANLLMARLSHFAVGLAEALEKLPLPIALPRGEHINLVGEFRPAVARAYELVEDQPMPEDKKGEFIAVILFWLAASDLVIAYVHSGEDYRADAAILNIGFGENELADLLSWLSDQE
ncbi:hypothetical protein ABZ369_22465 [Streptomyces sp. NPDC005918]|uniref:hypothetical protein n=1 Tax=Streptomyces sp. NPDC005918 TaxID=3155454 RepID=UPI00340FE79B